MLFKTVIFQGYLYTRGKEHRKNYEKKEAESFMMRHQQEKHFGAEADFKGKVKCQFKDWHQPALWRVRMS